VGHLERGGGGVRYARARVRQSGLRESVRTGETGFLVPHGDARALADRMLALAADPGLVARLGRGARSFAEQLSWERAARATEAHLHRVIAQGG